MKAVNLLLTVGLLIANGLSAGETNVDPARSAVTEHTYWRNGYTDWRGAKISNPEWETFEADDGSTFAIDMKSLANVGQGDALFRGVAYLVDGAEFNPNRLITLIFNCKNFVNVVTFATADQVRSVEKKVLKLACP
jgi:hypothetical protein